MLLSDYGPANNIRPARTLGELWRTPLSPSSLCPYCCVPVCRARRLLHRRGQCLTQCVTHPREVILQLVVQRGQHLQLGFAQRLLDGRPGCLRIVRLHGRDQSRLDLARLGHHHLSTRLLYVPGRLSLRVGPEARAKLGLGLEAAF